MIEDFDANLSSLFGLKCDSFAVRTFCNNSAGLSLGNSIITILKTPRYTLGSSSFLIAIYLFTGDTVFADSVGSTDFPFGNANDLRKSVGFLLNPGDDILVCPDHDETILLRDLKKNNAYVKQHFNGIY